MNESSKLQPLQLQACMQNLDRRRRTWLQGSRRSWWMNTWTALAGCSCSSFFLSWRPMPRISDGVCTHILNQCWCAEGIFAKTTLRILSVQGDWRGEGAPLNPAFLPYMQVWLEERKTSLAHKIGKIVFDSQDDNQQMFWTALLARG